MSRPAEELLTPGEAAAIAGVAIRSVYKAAAERLPKRTVVRRAGQMFLTSDGVVCLSLDRELPKDVPVRVRRRLYDKIEGARSGRVEHGTGSFRYVIDAGPVAKTVETRIEQYRKAMALIVEDPEIQGGAATFRGTRLLVHQVADLLEAGVPKQELREDYPNLTAKMVEAARIYAQAHPRRGRPRKPNWRHRHPKSERTVGARGA